MTEKDYKVTMTYVMVLLQYLYRHYTHNGR
jgi:hypothetical protein